MIGCAKYVIGNPEQESGEEGECSHRQHVSRVAARACHERPEDEEPDEDRVLADDGVDDGDDGDHRNARKATLEGTPSGSPALAANPQRTGRDRHASLRPVPQVTPPRSTSVESRLDGTGRGALPRWGLSPQALVSASPPRAHHSLHEPG